MKKTILTILIIILIALLGLIAYQWFNNEKVEINNESYEGMNLTIDKLNYLSDSDKIDSTKPFVYAIMPLYDELDGYSDTRKIRQYKNEFVEYEQDVKEVKPVPYININFKEANKINYMLKAYCLSNYQSIYDLNMEDEDEFFTRINVYNDILSIYVSGKSGETDYNLGINIDLKNKKLLSLDDVMKKISIKDEDIITKLEDNHNEMKDNNSLYYETDVIELFSRLKTNANKDYKIFRDNIDLNKPLDDYAKMDHYYFSGTDKWEGYTVSGWNIPEDETYKFADDLVNNQKVCYYINEENKMVINFYYKQLESHWVHDNEIIIKDAIDENVEINNESYSVLRMIGEDYSSNISALDNTILFTKIDKINYLTNTDKKDANLPFIYKIAPKYTSEKYDKKLNSGKVITLDYRQFRNEFEMIEEEQENIISIPYLNINIDGIDKINYILKAVCLNQNSIADFDFCPNIIYSITIKDDILSLCVETDSNFNQTIKSFNIDLKNKKILSDEEFFNRLDLNEDEIKTQISKYLKGNPNLTYNIVSFDDLVDKIYNELLSEFKNEELIFGYKIDLNKNLNDFAKYDFENTSITSNYAYINNGDCIKRDGTNNIYYGNNGIEIRKYLCDLLNDNYYKEYIYKN